MIKFTGSIFLALVFLLVSSESSAETISLKVKQEVSSSKISSLLKDRGFALVPNSIEVVAVPNYFVRYGHEIVDSFGRYSSQDLDTDLEYVRFTAEKDGQKYRGGLYVLSANSSRASTDPAVCVEFSCVKDPVSGNRVGFVFIEKFLTRKIEQLKEFRNLNMVAIPSTVTTGRNDPNN